MSSDSVAGPGRPARRQVDAPVTGHEEAHAPGTVNIWTGRVLREHRKPREGRRKEASQYRCLPKADSGETRGSRSGAGYCCLYFARGICHHGADCNFLHRVPTARDEERHKTDYAHDIFGRERQPEGRDSRKKGVGSYERECRTLYVHYGGAGTLPADQLRKIVWDNFAEWGPLESVHLVPAKTLAFVRYQWRSSAEFAKAAMHQQTLRGCDTTEVLDVRWANDDPNPRAVARVQHEREVALRGAYTKAVNELPPDAKRARIQQLHLAATVRPGAASASYPDTDAQYGAGGGSSYRHDYEGWDSYLYGQAAAAAGGGASLEAATDPVAASAQWDAWHAWQAQHPGSHYPQPGGAGQDSYARYMRPEDAYWEQQAQQQQAEQGGASGAAAAAAGGGGHEQEEAAEDADEVAQEALGLIGGYGSSSESGEATRTPPPLPPPAAHLWRVSCSRHHATMADFSRFVANKLNGEWSASNVSSMLTDTILEYLVTGDKWESLDPLVRSRLLLAPLFMRKRELAELQPALGKLAAAGAADKDEWVRAMAQSVDGYDGRLHTDKLMAGSKLVSKTVAGMQPLLDKADPRLFRPLEEVYMNKELLQKLRGGAGGLPAGAQQAQQAGGASDGAPKPHHHFRLRPAAKAPSQRQAGGAASPAGRPQPALAQGASGAGAQPSAARAAAALQRPRGAGSDREGGSSAAAAAAAGLGSRPGRLAPASIDSMFLPRKPGLGRPSSGGLGGRGRGLGAQPKKAATLDIESVKNLNQQRQAERERQLKAQREAAEAAARERAEAKERERAVKEAEKELEAKRVAAARAAEKAAKREAQEAAKVETSDAKEKARAAKAAAKAAKEEAAAAKAAEQAAAKDGQRAPKGGQRKRAAPGGAEGEDPPAKRHSASDEAAAGQREAAAVVAAAVQRPAAAATPAPTLMSPEATAAALGDAALAAAADEAGVPGLPSAGGVPNLEVMHSFLTAAYGGAQRESSDEEEPDV